MLRGVLCLLALCLHFEYYAAHNFRMKVVDNRTFNAASLQAPFWRWQRDVSKNAPMRKLITFCVYLIQEVRLQRGRMRLGQFAGQFGGLTSAPLLVLFIMPLLPLLVPCTIQIKARG